MFTQALTAATPEAAATKSHVAATLASKPIPAGRSSGEPLRMCIICIACLRRSCASPRACIYVSETHAGRKGGEGEGRSRRRDSCEKRSSCSDTMRESQHEPPKLATHLFPPPFLSARILSISPNFAKRFGRLLGRRFFTRAYQPPRSTHAHLSGSARV